MQENLGSYWTEHKILKQTDLVSDSGSTTHCYEILDKLARFLSCKVRNIIATFQGCHEL